MRSPGRRCVSALALTMLLVGAAEGATINVPLGGDLQAALNAAAPGDTILLAAGAEFVGNFVLPLKTGTGYIVVRSSTALSALPGPGRRIQPAHSPLLARLRSPNEFAALSTAPGAHHWRLQYLEFRANLDGMGDILQIGDGSSAQNTLASIPHDFILDHLYVHGDPLVGQKRGIALNAAQVTIRDSYISDCKGVGLDTQAIAGWNGPGPFVIENNYLEAAGENVMFGGADPAIPNLVSENILIRRNFFSRPMSWRNPIIPTPGAVTASAQGGGSLGAGTYAYRVVARRGVGGGTIGRSTASAEVSATVGAGGAVRVRWQAVPGALEYRVYGRSSGALNASWTVTTTEFVDDGSAGTPEAVPTSVGTQWTVKNLFELKSARNVTVQYNIFENHWKQAQPGWAIVLTPANSQGACTWCVVEQVRFEYNVVRNVAAGINILGYGSTRPTRQTADITFRHNLFYGLVTSLGGNAWFMQVGSGPRNLTVDHNTVDHAGTTFIYAYGGTSADPSEIVGAVITNNAAKHGSYGMGGAFFTYGNPILAGFYPGVIFSANYLAGASASRYPSGTLVSGVFADQFADAAGRDYTVRVSSPLHHAGTDGLSIGVDTVTLAAAVSGVESGSDAGINQAPVADFSASCTGLTCSFFDESSDVDGTVATRLWSFGDGTTSTAQDPVHAFAAEGTYQVTLQVVDNQGATSSRTSDVTVVAPNAAPAAAFTFRCTGLTCTFTDGSTDEDGTIVARAWSFGDGTPQGSGTSVSHTFGAAGSYSVRLTVTDNDGATASTTRTVQATPPATVHVGDLDGYTTQWKNYWDARVTLTLHNASEQPVAGATVAFTWTGAVNKTGTCVTTAAGQCLVKSGTLSHLRSTVSFTVNSITAAGLTHVPANNHDVDGGTNGTVISLPRPPIPPQ